MGSKIFYAFMEVSAVQRADWSILFYFIFLLQNAARIVRALFEMALRKGWPVMAGRLLQLSKTIEKRLWGFENPLRQFSMLPQEIFNKLEARKLTIDRLREMDSNDIGQYFIMFKYF